jgi:hypothetical protein
MRPLFCSPCCPLSESSGFSQNGAFIIAAISCGGPSALFLILEIMNCVPDYLSQKVADISSFMAPPLHETDAMFSLRISLVAAIINDAARAEQSEANRDSRDS